MVKFIKKYTPFILIILSLLFSICSYFDFYLDVFKYLGDVVGYSLLTNIFMYSYYMNKHFCASTKIAVLGLFFLNIFNLFWLYFEINGGMYDLLILLIVIFIIIFLKTRRNDTSNRRGNRVAK